MPTSQYSYQVIRDYIIQQGWMLPDRTLVDALAIYRAAVEFGITSAELGNVLGISGPQLRAWIVAQGLPPLPADADMGVSYVPLPAPAPVAPAPAVVVTTINPAPAPVAPPPPAPAPAPAVVVTAVNPAPAVGTSVAPLSRASIIAAGWMLPSGELVDALSIYRAAAASGVGSDALAPMIGYAPAVLRNWIIAQGLPPLPADVARGVTYTRIPSPPPAPAPAPGSPPAVTIAAEWPGGQQAASVDMKTVGIAAAVIAGAYLLRKKA